MIILGINTTSNTLNYGTENITIPANSQTTIPNSSLASFSQDPQVISDINLGNLQISDSFSIYSGTQAIQILTQKNATLSNSDKSGSGILANIGDAISAITNGCSSVTFNISGSWSGSLIIEATIDGTNWFTWNFIIPTGAISSTVTTNGAVTAQCGSLSQVRFRATSISGTVNISWCSSSGSNVFQIYNSNAASLQTTSRTQDSSGNGITSVLDGSNRKLNVNTPDSTSSSSISVAGNSSSFICNSLSTVIINIGGAFSGATLLFESSQDGIQFFAVYAYEIASSFVTAPSVSGAVSTNHSGSYVIPCAGFNQVRVRASVLASGTVNIAFEGSIGRIYTPVVSTTATNFKTSSNINDGSGNLLTSTLFGSKQSLDQNIVNVQDKSGSGTISALNGNVVITSNGASTIFFNVTGTWSATLSFQGQSGDGTWFNILGFTPGGAIVAGSLASNNAIVLPCGGYEQVRIIATAYTSGTATVTWNCSAGVNGIQVFNTIASSLLTSSRTQDGSGNAITSVLSGSDRYLEVAAIQDVNTSTVNSSTANLAAGATFTGNSESTLGVAALQVNFKSDQNFTIQVQQSIDGTNWDVIDSFTVLANVGDGRTFQRTAAFFRILATNNGGSTTTFLRLQTELCPTVETVARALTASGNLKIEAQAATFGYYSAPVNIRQTAATAANATVWAIRNAVGSTKSVYIQTIYLMMAFDTGTPITRSLQRYQIQRFSIATPTAGTSIPIALMDSSDPVTVVTDARFLDTGLTTTSIVFDNPIVIISCPATDATTTQYTRLNAGIRLAPGEGLCIRLTVAAVVGQGLSGEIVWIEK